MSRVLRLAALASVACVLLISGPQAARAQQNGTIAGHITNGTAGAASPADVEVVVHILQNRVKIDERRVRTDANGNFRVTDLATGAEMLYFPIVEHAGVPYFPDRAAVLDGPNPVPVEIAVYEATPKPDSISFERLNMLVMTVSPTALTIMEMGAVVNAGDRTFAADAQVTGSARTLRFALPPGAIEVAPQAGLPGDSLESTPDGFASTDPVLPGRREIAFSYQLPFTAAALDLTRTFAFPVGTFTLYVPNEVGVVMAGGVAIPSMADLGGRQFRQYAVDGIVPGGDVRFRLTGLPAPLFARPRDLGLAVVGVAGAVLLGCLVLAVRRRASRAAPLSDAPTESAEAVSAPLAAERLDVLRAVAQLDERFATGGLDEASYQAERAEQKARLVALTRSLAGTP